MAKESRAFDHSKYAHWIDPNELIPYGNNFKLHTAKQVKNIANSIKRFGWQQDVVITTDNVLVIGHGRRLAAIELGCEIPYHVIDKTADQLTEQDIRELRIADNKTNSETGYDFDLMDVEIGDLEFEGFDFDFSEPSDQKKPDKELYEGWEDAPKGSLSDRFIVPPFSVLDTRQGYWQERKRAWDLRTGDASETRDGEFGRIGGGSRLLDAINGGTSNFDPVLAETMYKWFCIPDGKILDPFGGEQVKGVVAGELGYRYSGCEIRQEQCELNRRKVAPYADIKYYCGDSNYIKDLIPDRDFDMLFTSPPYYDLEVYSKEDMSALGTYAEFMEQYTNIFQQCFEMLRENTFAVVKVGEIRDKKTGIYRNFVADTIKTLCSIGFKFYDDIVLVNAVGNGAIRANNYMRTRKVVKLHQNVLVFYKGNPSKIAENFPEIEFEEMQGEEDVL